MFSEGKREGRDTPSDSCGCSLEEMRVPKVSTAHEVSVSVSSHESFECSEKEPQKRPGLGWVDQAGVLPGTYCL